MAQQIDVLDSLGDVRPHPLEKRAIAGEVVILLDQVDELAVAVMLRDGITAARTDAARHVSIGALISRIPVDEAPHLFGMTQAEERRGRERPVADPRAIV